MRYGTDKVVLLLVKETEIHSHCIALNLNMPPRISTVKVKISIFYILLFGSFIALLFYFLLID